MNERARFRLTVTVLAALTVVGMALQGWQLWRALTG